MQLLLVRHAIAVERGLPGFSDDAARPLTERGRARMREASAGLKLLAQPDVILTSPLLRARQTAEILAEALKMHRIEVSSALATGDQERLLEDVRATGGACVAAVGHEPHISATLAFVLTGDDAGMVSIFRKGAAALVTFDGEARAGEGMLEWLMQPRALRATAGAG